ncbi:hypothetical protein [Aquimarina sp. RZ0]|uniref:hypothetical protein n=1 Tax=Aquimarina sp. RZ0 TaxID=2607730 RepID=UPI0011F15E16|nr:hypothetical protein [Aquimarina sp. RZ0]KAA1247033.1 hypothetical protein F0000_04935 [Aquimarina sp. RZ0]
MKNQILLFICIAIISCKEGKKPTYENIEIEQIGPDPVVHESLTEEQLEKIKEIYNAFKEVYPISLQETIKNFKRDHHPDKEIELWSAMVTSYKKASSKNKGEDLLEKRKEIFRLILMRSVTSEEDVLKNLDLQTITKTEAKEILDSYQIDKKPIKIETH